MKETHLHVDGTTAHVTSNASDTDKTVAGALNKEDDDLDRHRYVR